MILLKGEVGANAIRPILFSHLNVHCVIWLHLF